MRKLVSLILFLPLAVSMMANSADARRLIPSYFTVMTAGMDDTNHPNPRTNSLVELAEGWIGGNGLQGEPTGEIYYGFRDMPVYLDNDLPLIGYVRDAQQNRLNIRVGFTLRSRYDWDAYFSDDVHYFRRGDILAEGHFDIAVEFAEIDDNNDVIDLNPDLTEFPYDQVVVGAYRACVRNGDTCNAR